MSAIKFKLQVPNDNETKSLEFKLESGADNKTLLDGLLEFQKEINTTLTHFVEKEKKVKEKEAQQTGGKKKEDAAPAEDMEQEDDSGDGVDEADESVKNDKIIDEIKNQSKSKRLKGSE